MRKIYRGRRWKKDVEKEKNKGTKMGWETDRHTDLDKMKRGRYRERGK